MFDFHIDIPGLVESLGIMGRGMFGIFVVILAIYGSIALLNKIFAPKNKQ